MTTPQTVVQYLIDELQLGAGVTLANWKESVTAWLTEARSRMAANGRTFIAPAAAASAALAEDATRRRMLAHVGQTDDSVELGEQPLTEAEKVDAVFAHLSKVMGIDEPLTLHNWQSQIQRWMTAARHTLQDAVRRNPPVPSLSEDDATVTAQMIAMAQAHVSSRGGNADQQAITNRMIAMAGGAAA